MSFPGLSKVPTPTVRPLQDDNNATIELLFQTLQNAKEFLEKLCKSQNYSEDTLLKLLSSLKSAVQQDIFFNYSNQDHDESTISERPLQDDNNATIDLLFQTLQNAKEFLKKLYTSQNYSEDTLLKLLSSLKSAEQQDVFSNYSNQDHDDHDEPNS